MHELICKQLCKRYIVGRFSRRNITNRAIANEEHSSTRKLGDNGKWEQNLTWTLALSSNFITQSLFCSYSCISCWLFPLIVTSRMAIAFTRWKFILLFLRLKDNKNPYGWRRRLCAKTAEDVTKSRNRVNEHRKQENENGLTKQGIGNEVTDRPRVPGFVLVLVTSISANGSTLNYAYLMIYLLTAPDEVSPNISV